MTRVLPLRLAAALVPLAGLLALAPPPAPPTAPAEIDTLRAVARSVVDATNRTRRERGRSPVAAESTLTRIACAHTHDMLTRRFFDHVNPDGLGPARRVARRHRTLVGGVGENLLEREGPRPQRAAPLAAEILTQWMNSPPHRETLLVPAFTHVGVCVLQAGGLLRATQIFADVRAYLDTPLPRTARPGAAHAVSIAHTRAPDDLVARYDFWDPRREQRVTPPRIFADTLRFPDTTGTFRPRFYVLESDRYSIHPGPEVTVTAAP
jgi:uncharacterized protein YkwD